MYRMNQYVQDCEGERMKKWNSKNKRPILMITSSCKITSMFGFVSIDGRGYSNNATNLIVLH